MWEWNQGKDQRASDHTYDNWIHCSRFTEQCSSRNKTVESRWPIVRNCALNLFDISKISSNGCKSKLIASISSSLLNVEMRQHLGSHCHLAYIISALHHLHSIIFCISALHHLHSIIFCILGKGWTKSTQL